MSSVARVCSVSHCDGEVHCRGLCTSHYTRRRKGVDNWDAPIKRWYKESTCIAPECQRKQRALGLCTSHYSRMHRYGLTVDRLVELEGRNCQICDESPGGRVLHSLDHDHTCCEANKIPYCGDCVRGVLCHSCNLALGHFQDDPVKLRKALSYLSANGIE